MQLSKIKKTNSNHIKILPTRGKDCYDNPKNMKRSLSVKNIEKKTVEKVIELPKISRLETKLYNESKSFQNILSKQSVLNTSVTLLNPKVRDRSFMIAELDKIIYQCNDDSFKNTLIADRLNRTESEMTEVVKKIESINEPSFKAPKRLKLVGRQPPMGRSTIKLLICNMRRNYIRTMAI
jgi:seryl-tRNA synthetase